MSLTKSSVLAGNLATCQSGGVLCVGGRKAAAIRLEGGAVLAHNMDVDSRQPDIARIGNCTIDGWGGDTAANWLHIETDSNAKSVLAVVSALAAQADILLPAAVLAQLETEFCCGSNVQPCSWDEFSKAFVQFTKQPLAPGVSLPQLSLRDGDMVHFRPGAPYMLASAFNSVRNIDNLCRPIVINGRSLHLVGSGLNATIEIAAEQPWLELQAGSRLSISKLRIRAVPSASSTAHCLAFASEATLATVTSGGILQVFDTTIEIDAAASSSPCLDVRAGGQLTMTGASVAWHARAMLMRGIDSRSSFHNCTLSGAGGRIQNDTWLYVSDAAVVSIAGGTVHGLNLGSRDGAFARVTGKAVLQGAGVEFYDLQARDAAGIWVAEGGLVQLKGCSARDISARSNGGLVFAELQGHVQLVEVTCTYCVATAGGALLYAGNLAKAMVTNCSVIRHSDAALTFDSFSSAVVNRFRCSDGTALRGACIHALGYESLTVLDSEFRAATSTATSAVAVGGALVTLEQARSSAVTSFINCTWSRGIMVPSVGGDVDEIGGFVGGGVGIHDPGDSLRYDSAMGSQTRSLAETRRRTEASCTDSVTCAEAWANIARELMSCRTPADCGDASRWYSTLWDPMSSMLASSGTSASPAILRAYWFVGCLFEGNTAQGRGGGLHISASVWRHALLLSCRFVRNAALTGRGGGLYVAAPTGQRLYLLDTTAEGNQSPFGGTSAIHVARGVMVSGQYVPATETRPSNASSELQNVPIVSRDGVCEVGWVIPVASTGECVRCRGRGFSWWPGEAINEQCHSCPDGAECSGGDSVISQAGSFVVPMLAHVVAAADAASVALILPCKPFEACIANASYEISVDTASPMRVGISSEGTRCAAGYSGSACTICAHGYGSSGSTCRPCINARIPPLLFALIKLVIVLFVATSMWHALTSRDYTVERKAVVAGVMYLALLQVQLFGVILNAPGLKVPSGLTVAGILGSLASGTGTRSVLAPECLWRSAGEGAAVYIDSLATIIQAVVLVPLLACVLWDVWPAKHVGDG